MTRILNQLTVTAVDSGGDACAVVAVLIGGVEGQ